MMFVTGCTSMSDFEFTDITGQTLTKEPGSINGRVLDRRFLQLGMFDKGIYDTHI